MADAQRFSVERQYMVIVVVRGKVSGYLGRGAAAKIEPVKASFAIVDQRLAIAGPVGRLKRVRRPVNHPPVACRYVENLNIAADIVSIGYEVVVGWPGDLYIAKQNLLDYISIMRANEESDIDVVSQRQIGNHLGCKGLAKPRHRHDVTRPLPSTLSHTPSLDRRPYLLGTRTRLSPKLQ